MSTTGGNPESCVVCFKTVEYYSVGECDHPVCYECSTRMRVLCLQNECPICRQQLARVVFTDAVQSYKQLRSQVFADKLFERQFKIGFCSEAIKNAYEQLLEHRCRLCEKQPPFRTFNLLSDHIRKVHERYFCDLCVKHLKIFTCERRCYTRQELARHRRKGDIDDTSHRGHPLCEFCEERYMDTDELYRHLRKEHLYCHLCDADGRNLYYGSHKDLAQHFRTDHYLCEEGECATQHLTAVFRSEIDLIAHKASVHGRGLARAASRQARTLELQFNITPHAAFSNRQPRSEGNLAGSGGGRDGGSGGRDGGGGGRDGGGGGREVPQDSGSMFVSGPPPPSIDMGSVQQFPRLSSAPAAPSLLAAPSRHYQGSSTLVKTKENFPALDGGSTRAPPPPSSTPRGPPAAAMLRTNMKPSVSIQLHGQPASASSFRLTAAGGNRISNAPQPNKTKANDRERLYEDFPSLSTPNDDHPSIGASTLQPPKVALVSSEQMQAMKSNNSNQGMRKPQLNLEEAFPALSSRSAPAAPAQWVTISKPKEKAKPSKAAPAPKIKSPTFNHVADFPHLALTNTKSKNKKCSTEQPSTAAPKPAADENTKLTSKKEKKKQSNNNKMLVLQDTSRPNGILETSQTNKASTAWDGKNIGKETNSTTDNINTEISSNGDEKLTNGEVPFQLVDEYYPPLSKSSMSNGPPGFKCRPSCDGLTFTNSTGQTFSAPLHSYIPPPDFNQRNVQLVKKFADALGPAAMQEFKDVSRAFRNGDISAEGFYSHCKAAVGSRLEDLFPELVALLPDIGKQQELVVGREAGLDMCAACGQLLALADRTAHATAHWPALGSR